VNALRRRPLFAWIALLAITLAALMPTVSRALAPSRAELPAGWVEICSGAGMQWVSLQTEETVRTHPGDPDAPQGVAARRLCLLRVGGRASGAADAGLLVPVLARSRGRARRTARVPGSPAGRRDRARAWPTPEQR